MAATARGKDLAGEIAAAWPEARTYPGRPSEQVRRAWPECEGLILFMALGAAVRLIAPYLGDKRSDPGVVCVDAAARFAVALAGGHEGGANALASRVAGKLGATPVITTASESLGIPDAGSIGSDLGFRIDPASDTAMVGASLIRGETVAFFSDQRWPLPALGPGLSPSPEPLAPGVVVSDRLQDWPRPSIICRPPSLVVGVGCSRGVSAEAILALIGEALASAGLSALSVARLATIDLKASEPGLVRAAEQGGWPLETHPADELASIPVPNPSRVVEEAVGTRSVAEAAVIASGAKLIAGKMKSGTATAAIGRLQPRGRLFLIGTGPGDLGLLSPLACESLRLCESVFGLDRYLDQVRPVLAPGTRVAPSPIGGEMERARAAVAEAAAGGSVALVSGGDTGVYGMASPALEEAPVDIDVVGVPGITAAVAAASLLGAPLGHDHCCISLSDLLTPWEVIEDRVDAAGRADLVIAFYNPRSKGRPWQLGRAIEILLRHRKPSTPVGVVTSAYRPGQQVSISTLEGFDPAAAGMTTTVIVGSSATVVRSGRMITPRGWSG